MLFGFPSHPLAIDKQGYDAKSDEKDNREHQNDTGLTACPVSSLRDDGHIRSLRLADHNDSGHFDSEW